ncbi:hypothetical protein BES34_011085 [Leptospira inadai serovar Lyme]|uniref:Uncharacterized protein n=1 Tax=Leptospira inadai serovar Lyme TaxID=293084 RepID=A0ABX4YHS1_9LEPT|nr:hypothetical protein BES34_011085 [Leptospira inadai serovar Lyme]
MRRFAIARSLNLPGESFFETRKAGENYRKKLNTIKEVKYFLFDDIERYYGRRGASRLSVILTQYSSDINFCTNKPVKSRGLQPLDIASPPRSSMESIGPISCTEGKQLNWIKVPPFRHKRR